METPYSRITEIKEAAAPEEANSLLKQGFILVKVMEKYTNTPERQFSNIVYVLGRQRFNGESHAAPEQSNPSNNHTAPSAIDPALLEKRPWKKYANGGGEWAFYMDRDENLLPELSSIRETIERLKSGEELTVGNYTYRIKDKFLKRFPADATQE
ncbi:MAG: hypothetical protein ABSA72_13295 [Nitrososphaerales archaeon]